MAQVDGGQVTSLQKRTRLGFSSLRPEAGFYWVILLGVFALAIFVRVAALGSFITADEPGWIDRSGWFTSGLLFPDDRCPSVQPGRAFGTKGWGCTLQSGHPGVTTMWGGSLGLLLYYWQTGRFTGLDLRTILQTINPDSFDAALIAPVRLPLTIVNGLFLIPFYLLLRRLLNKRIAFLATLLLALTPSHVALSRILGHDALTTTFLNLALLAMVGYWLRGWRWYWLLLSAVLTALACLSKSLGWFMVPFAALVGGLNLFYRWHSGHWQGWPDIWRLLRELVLWNVMVWLTFIVCWPAMWVIPIEVIQTVFSIGVELAEAGHTHYFLGQVSSDPGPLFYPISWLFQASPIEVVGLVALLVAVGRSSRRQFSVFFRQQITNHPIEIAFGLFAVTFLLFETVITKKMQRYFLPALPVIDVYAAIGLLWLINVPLRQEHQAVHRWRVALLGSFILLIQGWLLWTNYPYYSTYYNPLLGGARGAARLITLGWGEGLDQAATYLNNQPKADSLNIAVCGYKRALNPFFVGDSPGYAAQTWEVMEADYLVYYLAHLQRNLCEDTWSYFQQHSTPVHRVSLQGVDYVLIYHNPIEQRIHWQTNNPSNGLTVLGYNVADSGILTLFWQHLGMDQPQLVAGLTPALGDTTHWVSCTLAPAFVNEAKESGAILESTCPLATTALQSDIYELYLGLNNGSEILPLAPSGPALLSIDPTMRFKPVQLNTVLAALAGRQLPANATPLDIFFNDKLRLAGYQLNPSTWQSGHQAELILYLQPIRPLESSLSQIFHIVLRLSSGTLPIMEGALPLLPQPLATGEMKPGTIIPIHYPLSLPTTLSSGAYTLNVCLIFTASGESVFCLPLSVTVV
jgi:4-amino-4-deoxy-L-arabinose transferase-like glycosyltransferase